IRDTYYSIEGAGLGINPAGQTADDTTTYYGVQLQGIEHLELRLADGRIAGPGISFDDGADNLTIVNSPTSLALTIWGGGGGDAFTVRGIGGPATISGGDG